MDDGEWGMGDKGWRSFVTTIQREAERLARR